MQFMRVNTAVSWWAARFSALCATAAAADTSVSIARTLYRIVHPGEILTQTARAAGARGAPSRAGNTAIVLNALTGGSIDVYPEYRDDRGDP